MPYEDLLLNLNKEDKRIARLAWNTANTNVINALSGIAFREIGNGNHEKAKMLVDLALELHPVLNYQEAE